MPTPEELLAMDEVTLAKRVLNEVPNSRQFDQMYAAFSLKLTLRNQANAEETSTLTQQLVAQTTALATQTTKLATQTRNLMIATWALAAIAFLTFLASIYFDKHKDTAPPTFTPASHYD